MGSPPVFAGYKLMEVFLMPSSIQTLRRKRSEHKKLVEKLDKVVREIIKARDKKCVTCGNTQGLQCGHLFSRSAFSTRWDLRNCNAQCYPCNFRHELDSYPYNKWFITKYGQKEWDRLHLRYSTAERWTEVRLQEKQTILEAVLRGMI